MSANNYLVDCFTTFAASAMAANTVLRSIVGAVLPMAGPSLYNNLGYGCKWLIHLYTKYEADNL
jgi:hypothetical protein